MKLTPKVRMRIGNVIVITICYTLISIFITFFNHSIINSPIVTGISELYSFRVYLLFNLLIGLLAGVLGGSTIVTVNSSLFRKKPFRYSILTTSAAFVLIFILVSVIGLGITVLDQIGSEATLTEFSARFSELFLIPTSLTLFILWFAITLFTLFLLQVNDKFGPGILAKFIVGKYHYPRSEQRFIMFLDMRSSTTIAVKLAVLRKT